MLVLKQDFPEYFQVNNKHNTFYNRHEFLNDSGIATFSFDDIRQKNKKIAIKSRAYFYI